MNLNEQSTTFIVSWDDLNARTITLVTEGLRIGRANTCDIVLNHPLVARLNAGIRQIEGRSYVLNLSTSNPVLLNDRPVPLAEAVALTDSDIVKVGPFLLHITFEGGAVCVRVQSLTGKAWAADNQEESNKDGHRKEVSETLNVFWEKRSRERIIPARPESAPSLPRDTRLRSISKKLHRIFRQVIARFDERDPVDFTVFSPPVVRTGEMFLVQVFVHRPEQAQTTSQLAKEFDADTARRGYTSLEAEVAKGEVLMVHLSLPSLQVNYPQEHLRWDGRPCAVQFNVLVPAEGDRRTVIGTAMISDGNVPLGHIKFKLGVETGSTVLHAVGEVPTGESARRYRKAFISYASDDRAEVVKRVQMLAQLKINYFQDIFDLEPGARWKQQLYRYIDDSDLFLLFWSSSAKNSEWVMNEVNYALKRQEQNAKGLALPEIIPVIIEGPPPVKPPPELAHLHFNDYLIYFTLL